MNNVNCPECGFGLTEARDVCPECGCPLSKELFSSKDKADSGEGLQAEVNNNGCIATWRKHCKDKAAPVVYFNRLDSGFGWVAIAFTVFVIIYLIANGIALNSNEKLYSLFQQLGLTFAIIIIVFFCLESICATIAHCLEVKRATHWLVSNDLSTSDCLELKSYGKTKKESASFSVHNIDVAYCGAHPTEVGKSIARSVGKCVLYVVCTVVFGLFALPVVGQFILDEKNIYIFAGFFAGALAVEFLHWAIKRIIDKSLYKKVDEWKAKK
ncbi:MAG: hypothetical protein J1F71_01480 [Clostridiales bacterium]|nr:hypothetical protein [Clostridiales bacterium]